MQQHDPVHVPPEVSAPDLAASVPIPVAAVTSSPVITHTALADAPTGAQAAAVDTDGARTHPPLTTADLAAHLSLRDVVLRAYPDVVAELVQGETLADLFATLPRAQEAWQRVVARVDAAAGAAGAGSGAASDGAALTTPSLPAIDRGGASIPPPSVAGGSPVRSGQPGLELLTPLARIRAGLRSS